MELGRQDILRRTLEGLEGDLEELRDELAQALEDFEGALREHVAQMPVWLDLPAGRVLRLFKYPPESTFQGALLGPRAVAFAAGEVEEFIHAWVGDSGELYEHDLAGSPELASQHRRDLAAIERYLDRLETESEAVAMAARASLGHLRDEILAELEEERRLDAETLEDLVAEGDLTQGRQARVELAELWEEQRRRADAFTRRWAALEEMTDRGLDITTDGLDLLRELLTNARLGLSQSHPSLYEEPPAADPATSSPTEPPLGHARAEPAAHRGAPGVGLLERDARRRRRLQPLRGRPPARARDRPGVGSAPKARAVSGRGPRPGGRFVSARPGRVRRRPRLR